MSELSFSAESFSGVARLFPVPGLVMFPHVIQPLRIFEPRYRDMLSDAMADDRLIAMPLLSSGWEKNYDGRPPLEPIACLGRVVSHQRCADGRSNILLLGLHRIRLVDELPPTKTFREAHVHLVDDIYPPAGDAQRAKMHCVLLKAFKRKLSRELNLENCLDELLRSDISLAVLTDIVAHTLNISVAYKTRLLSEPNVDERCRLLLAALLRERRPKKQKAAAALSEFPPKFSLN